MANIERLQRVMDHIMDNPQHHFQADWIITLEPDGQAVKLKAFNEGDGWACGTAACFAGWATLLYAGEVGYRQAYPDGTMYVPIEEGHGQRRRKHVRELAIEILDLNDRGGWDDPGTEATVLFSGGNSRSQLQAMVKDLANGEDIVENYRNGLYRREKV